MTSEYKDALAEVDYILSITSKNLLEKIPNSFLNFIKRHKTKNYKFDYNKELSLNEQHLKEETKAILALIYRSYLCPTNLREKYKIDDIIKLEKHQIELAKKDSHDNIFKKNNMN